MTKNPKKRQNRKRATIRQTKAANAILLNVVSEKPVSTGEVLKRVGYGIGLQNSPQRVLESEGFIEAAKEIGLREALIKEGITTNKIASKINVLLDAKKKTFRNNTSTGEIEEIGEEDDHQSIDKGLRHATAIHGITEDKVKTVKNTYNIMFSPEVQGRVRDINADIKRILINGPDDQKD